VLSDHWLCILKKPLFSAQEWVYVMVYRNSAGSSFLIPLGTRIGMGTPAYHGRITLKGGLYWDLTQGWVCGLATLLMKRGLELPVLFPWIAIIFLFSSPGVFAEHFCLQNQSKLLF
jgi:hypothetical protein